MRCLPGGADPPRPPETRFDVFMAYVLIVAYLAFCVLVVRCS